ncbi:MAG: TerD family protein, partial [Actinomycetota bacterium]|nr:TerD family protein [Actinomycetota bacterium]
MTSPITLAKGQNAPLPASAVTVSVAVQAPTDLSALLVTGNGKVRSDSDFVFFDQPKGPGVQCVQAGAGWRLEIDPAQIPADVDTVRAVVNLGTPGQRFGQIAPPVATVADASGTPVASYQVTGLDAESIMVAVELYRRGTDWKVRAVGQGYAGGLADLISDHGVSVDDAPAAPAAAARTALAAPPATAAPAAAEPDTGGAFGHLQPSAPAAPQPAAPPAAFPPPAPI